MKGVLPPTIGKSVSELGGHRNVNGHEFKEGISKNQNFEPGYELIQNLGQSNGLGQASNSCVHPSVCIFFNLKIHVLLI